MMIAGLRSLERRTTVALIGADGEQVPIVVTALPFGWEVDIAREIKPPVPPKRVTMTGPGGKPSETVDREDAAFKAAEADASSLQLVAMVYSSLRNEPKIQWRSQRAAFTDAAEFYRAIREEMREFGFTLLDWNAITGALARLSGSIEKAVQKASADFLPEAQTAG